MATGRVRVNGAVMTEMGAKVDPTCDIVEVDGERVRCEALKVTLMLHKPLGFVTTMKDEHAKHIVSELVPTGAYPGLFPLGRLDRDTSGLLLFSADGALGFSVLRPRGHVVKRYLALVEGRPDERTLRTLRKGVMLDDGVTLPAEVEMLSGAEEACARKSLELPAPQQRKENRAGGRAAARSVCGERAYDGERGYSGTSADRVMISREYAAARARRAAACSVLRIGIYEGRNRQVRRMLEAVGHSARALHREAFGPLFLGDLPRGSWRLLSDSEVDALRTAVSSE